MRGDLARNDPGIVIRGYERGSGLFFNLATGLLPGIHGRCALDDAAPVRGNGIQLALQSLSVIFAELLCL